MRITVIITIKITMGKIIISGLISFSFLLFSNRSDIFLNNSFNKYFNSLFYSILLK